MSLKAVFGIVTWVAMILGAIFYNLNATFESSYFVVQGLWFLFTIFFCSAIVFALVLPPDRRNQWIGCSVFSGVGIYVFFLNGGMGHGYSSFCDDLSEYFIANPAVTTSAFGIEDKKEQQMYSEIKNRQDRLARLLELIFVSMMSMLGLFFGKLAGRYQAQQVSNRQSE